MRGEMFRKYNSPDVANYVATMMTTTPNLPLEGNLSKLALEKRPATNWTRVGTWAKVSLSTSCSVTKKELGVKSSVQ